MGEIFKFPTPESGAEDREEEKVDSEDSEPKDENVSPPEKEEGGRIIDFFRAREKLEQGRKKQKEPVKEGDIEKPPPIHPLEFLQRIAEVEKFLNSLKGFKGSSIALREELLSDVSWDDLKDIIINSNENDWKTHPSYYAAVLKKLETY